MAGLRAKPSCTSERSAAGSKELSNAWVGAGTALPAGDAVGAEASDAPGSRDGFAADGPPEFASVGLVWAKGCAGESEEYWEEE